MARAALWNLVIPARGRAALAKTKALVDADRAGVPVRAIIALPRRRARAAAISRRPSRATSSRSRAAGAWSTPRRSALVGPANAEAHFGAMVRALQVPGVRTATFWMDAAMPPTLLTRELLPVTRRLIVDTASLHAAAAPAGPRAPRGARPSRGRSPISAGCGWAASALLFAGLFDPPVGGGPLRQRDAAGGPPPRRR